MVFGFGEVVIVGVEIFLENDLVGNVVGWVGKGYILDFRVIMVFGGFLELGEWRGFLFCFRFGIIGCFCSGRCSSGGCGGSGGFCGWGDGGGDGCFWFCSGFGSWGCGGDGFWCDYWCVGGSYNVGGFVCVVYFYVCLVKISDEIMIW